MFLISIKTLTLRRMASEINQRKAEHIHLAFKSQMDNILADNRFYYEPLFGFHQNNVDFSTSICGIQLQFPLWISSMTGGTQIAKNINIRLAKIAAKHKLAMGLGSCRVILENDKNFKDFDVRKHIKDQPLFANIGIHQLAEIIKNKQSKKINDLISKLECNGLIIHINPLQEWLQPNGDRFFEAPIDTLLKAIYLFNFPIIVKEVGQGFGKKSIETLLELPFEAIELAGYGGTNFTKLESLRNKNETQMDAALIGHHCNEMITWINAFPKEKIKAKSIIYSGGINSFLDAYYLYRKSNINPLIGQGSAMLKMALISEKKLDEYVCEFIESFRMCSQFLQVR